MEDSPELRRLCFASADDYNTSCGDRVAKGLNDMELLKISHDAERNLYDNPELFAMAEGFFKIDVLDKIIAAKLEQINHLPSGSRGIDPIEIAMKYTTLLGERLDLPGARAMLHDSEAPQVTAQDIDAAARSIIARLESNESVQFISRWKPWCDAMERKDPEAYKSVNNIIKVRQAALGSPPARSDSNEYVTALSKLKDDEEQMRHELTVALTRTFLEEQGEEA